MRLDTECLLKGALDPFVYTLKMTVERVFQLAEYRCVGSQSLSRLSQTYLTLPCITISHPKEKVNSARDSDS